MCKLSVIKVAISLALILLSVEVKADVLAVQSYDRPFDLDIVDEVYERASDERSIDFQNNYLPEINTLISEQLGERLSLSTGEVNQLALNPNKLDLQADSDVRVYFVGEGAGYHNTLGFNTEGGGVETGNPQLIFPDSSSYNSFLSNSSFNYRSENYPLLPGDYVDLGTLSAGSHLDFFLISNGANGGTNVNSTDEDVNPDGIPHVVSFAIENSSYLLIGFEDLYGGGDRDFNDLLFVVDIGESNVQNLIETIALVPEPEEILLLLIGLGLVFFFYKKTELESNVERKAC